MRIGRYLRAFVVALSMTLRGERPTPPSRHPALATWTVELVKRVDAVYRAADAQGIRQPQREAIILTVDKRDLSVETLLAAIRHHGAEEYPYLLRNETEYSLTGIHANNLNDRYYALRLKEAPELAAEPLQRAITALSDHLDAIPAATPPAQPPGNDGQLS